MELAVKGLYRAKWTDQIHDEWISNLLENRQDLKLEQLQRTRALMDSAVPDCLVTGYENLICAVTLPDPGDRHVLAAAIASGADAIITYNLTDFPASEAASYDIEVQHPDEFLLHQFGLDPAAVITSAQACRARLRNPPVGAQEYLETLRAQSLPKTVLELAPFVAVL